MGRGRAPCCDKSTVRTGPWSPAEDLRLMNFIQKNGHSNWRALPKQAGLLRCGKSCRLRWINYLRPDVKRGNFTAEEEDTIIQLHNSIGNKWSKIASCLPGRTDNEIKNVWNTHLKKRLLNKSPPNPNMDLDTSSSSSSVQKLGSPSSSSSCAFNNSNKQEDHDLMTTTTTSDSDVDFWEVLDSLDPLQQVAVAGEENLSMVISTSGVEGKVDAGEVGEWLRILEDELGLGNQIDGDHQPEFETSFLQISTPLWPSSPAHHHYLGI